MRSLRPTGAQRPVTLFCLRRALRACTVIHARKSEWYQHAPYIGASWLTLRMSARGASPAALLVLLHLLLLHQRCLLCGWLLACSAQLGAAQGLATSAESCYQRTAHDAAASRITHPPSSCSDCDFDRDRDQGLQRPRPPAGFNASAATKPLPLTQPPRRSLSQSLERYKRQGPAPRRRGRPGSGPPYASSCIRLHPPPPAAAAKISPRWAEAEAASRRPPPPGVAAQRSWTWRPVDLKAWDWAGMG